MAGMLVVASRLLALLIGCLAYGLAFFMYENEEGKLQSRIERLWVGIDDRALLIGSRTAAFFNKVAEAETRGLNRIFGSQLLSFRVLGVSTSASCAGALLFVAFFNDGRGSGSIDARHFVEISFIAGFICLILAFLPALLAWRWCAVLSLLPSLLSLFYLAGVMLIHRSPRTAILWCMALLFSFLSDVLSIAIIRLMIRRIASAIGIFRIAQAILLQLLCIFLLFFAPLLPQLISSKGNRGVVTLALGVFAFLNISTVLLSSVFFAMLFVVILHKAFWPLIGRLIYPVARHEIVRNRKVMAGVGTACLLYAFHLVPNILKHTLESLAK